MTGDTARLLIAAAGVGLLLRLGGSRVTVVAVQSTLPAAIAARTEELFGRNLVNKQDYETQRFQLDQARLAVRAALRGYAAALVGWLASDECSFSTGAVFDISGGRATY